MRRIAQRVLACIVALPSAAVAAFGDVDPAYPTSALCGDLVSLVGDGTSITGMQAFREDYALHRLRADGTPDPGWGANGRAGLGVALDFVGHKVLLRTRDAGFLLLADAPYKLDANGALDASYGTAGRGETLPGTLHSAAMLPDGGIVALVFIPGPVASEYGFTRLNASGRIDRAFGTNGVLAGGGNIGAPYAWSVDSAGSVQVASHRSQRLGEQELQLRRFPGGAPESGIVPRDGVAAWMAPAARVDALGRLVLAAGCETGCRRVVVARYLADGRQDPSFTQQVLLDDDVGAVPTVVLWLDASGGVTAIVNRGASGFPLYDFRSRIYRLTDTGAFDPSFANGRTIGGSGLTVAQLDDGSFLASDNVQACSFGKRFGDRPKADAMLIEYEYRGRYFITAQGPESALLDADPATEKLRRTGRTFGAWLTAAFLPGSLPMCRFHGDPAAGPRGHFYSLQGAECDLVRADDARLAPGTRTWRFEGLAFSAAPVAANGACAANLQPVRRLFNDGPRRGIDPNHRHATDPAVIAEMQAQGWILEGVAFCAPPATR